MTLQMRIVDSHLPSTGFMIILTTLFSLAFIFSWSFKTTRLEKTINLVEIGGQHLYRGEYQAALNYLEQSALVDTDKHYRNLRYRDLFYLALEINNLEKAGFFLDEIIEEAPEMVSQKELMHFLENQPGPITAARIINGISQKNKLEDKIIKTTISTLLARIDTQNRAIFLNNLDPTIKP